ncbi:MAG: ADP-ribose pyrophosphatase [uncultured marine phage]|uniref:ADP-ribose pyrophosphatase n=1 Tax=uncultured marine phage TaxID=707152 RepID=A0A8D9FR03_9VIRU|nr:MAG: ADP-ribose pyrophosphatase [uncultured marine phage]
MKLLSSRKVYEGFLTILKLKVETSEGEIVEREVMSRAGGKKSDDAVAALVFDTDKQKFIFAEQFRSGLMNEDDQSLIEVVAGTLEEGENPEECMIREIEEEIGYKTDSIEYVGEAFVSPGGTTEKIFLYTVLVSEQISEGGGLADENEEIEIVEMDVQEVRDYNFRDMKTKLLVTEINNMK